MRGLPPLFDPEARRGLHALCQAGSLEELQDAVRAAGTEADLMARDADKRTPCVTEVAAC